MVEEREGFCAVRKQKNLPNKWGTKYLLRVCNPRPGQNDYIEEGRKTSMSPSLGIFDEPHHSDCLKERPGEGGKTILKKAKWWYRATPMRTGGETKKKKHPRLGGICTLSVLYIVGGEMWRDVKIKKGQTTPGGGQSKCPREKQKGLNLPPGDQIESPRPKSLDQKGSGTDRSTVKRFSKKRWGVEGVGVHKHKAEWTDRQGGPTTAMERTSSVSITEGVSPPTKPLITWGAARAKSP